MSILCKILGHRVKTIRSKREILWLDAILNKNRPVTMVLTLEYCQRCAVNINNLMVNTEVGPPLEAKIGITDDWLQLLYKSLEKAIPDVP